MRVSRLQGATGQVRRDSASDASSLSASHCDVVISSSATSGLRGSMARRRSQLAGGALSRRLRSFPERRSIEPGCDLPWVLTMSGIVRNATVQR